MSRSHGPPATLLLALLTACSPGADQPAEASPDRINPMIALHEADAPVFGLYAPSPGGGRARGDQPPPPVKLPVDRAREALGFELGDFVFDGSMERGVDAALPAFADFAGALREAGATARTHPLVVKAAKIVDPARTARDVARQLDTGVSGIMFVEVETAEETRTALSAMRWASAGGTRPEGDVGAAAADWGVDADEYRRRADLWPLAPDGELVAWIIVETPEGLANVREIAAVPGIGVLWPGAGTLRQLFTTTDDEGTRTLDETAWEDAIQTVLAACREFDVPCGFPAGPDDIEERMAQGFEVFVMGWGDAGFETVSIGRDRAGR
ncbi:MAG: aldolase/citrate lyase family protein [Longimicrobiales bacterium]